MKFSDERWVKLYTRDTMGWKRLTWQARCVLLHAFRKVDRIGAIDMDSEGIAGLALMLDLPEEVVEAGVEGKNGLLERGAATICEMGGATVFLLPNFVDAQSATTSGKTRMETSRELARDTVLRGLPPKGDSRTIARMTPASGDDGLRVVTPGDAGLQNVTRGDVSSPMVTSGDAGLRVVTSGDDQIRTDQNRSEENKTQTRAHAHTHTRGVVFQVQDQNPEPQQSDGTGPQTTLNTHQATLAAPESSEAVKTHPVGNQDPDVQGPSGQPTTHDSQVVYGPSNMPTEPSRTRVPESECRLWRVRWEEIYRDEVEATLEGTWGMSSDPRDVEARWTALKDAVKSHCVGPAMRDIEGWLHKLVPAFVAHAKAEGKPSLWSGYAPKGFLRWLNEGHHRTIVAPPKAAEPKPEPTHGAPYVPTDEERAAFMATFSQIGKLPEVAPEAAEPNPVIQPRPAAPLPEALLARIKKNFGGLVQRNGKNDETTVAFAKSAVAKLRGAGLDVPDDIEACALGVA